jgi:hypothetical protein
MRTPREFYETQVKPAYEAWLADPLTEWKAKAAVANADTLAERVFVYWRARDLTQVAGTKSPRRYRAYLTANVSEDFGLVRDIHDGHKHAVLDRADRRVTTSDQTGVAQMAWGEGAFGEGVFGGGDQIVVRLDNGSKRVLSAIMKNVMTEWEKLLVKMGL